MSIRNISVVLFFCLSGILLQAQDGWHRLYSFKMSQEYDAFQILGGTPVPEGNIILTGAYDKDTLKTLYITQIDDKTKEKWSKKITTTYSMSTDQYWKGLPSIAYDPVNASIYVRVTLISQKVELFVFDKIGNIQSHKIFDSSDTRWESELQRSHNGIYGLSGTDAIAYFGYDNTEWFRKYTVEGESPNTAHTFHSLQYNPVDSITTVGRQENDGNVGYMQLDSVGNILDYRQFKASESIREPFGISVQDSGSMYLANKSDAIMVWRVDTSGTVIWSKEMKVNNTYTQLDDITLSNSGQIHVAGHYGADEETRKYFVTALIPDTVLWVSNFKDNPLDKKYTSTTLEHANRFSYLYGNCKKSITKENTGTVMKINIDGSTTCSQELTYTLSEASVTLENKTITAQNETRQEGTKSDVIIVSESPFDIPVLSIAPENTQFCLDENISETLNAYLESIPKDKQSATWNDGSSADTLVATEADKPYSVMVEISHEECYVLCDTVVLTRYKIPKVEIVPSFVNCESSLKAFASGGKAPYTFTWDNGSTEDAIKVTDEKTYSVTVTDECKSTGQGSLTFQKPELSVTIEEQINDCNVSLLQAKVPDADKIPGLTYTWSNNTEVKDILVDKTGTYTVMVNDSCGRSAQATINVTIENKIDLKLDLVSVDGCSEFRIVAGSIGAQAPIEYMWSTNETTPSIEVTQSGTYSLSVTDNCGIQATESIDVDISKEKAFNLQFGYEKFCTGNDNKVKIFEDHEGKEKVKEFFAMNEAGDTFTNLQDLAPDVYYVTWKGECGTTFQDTFNLLYVCDELKFPKAFFPGGNEELEKGFGAFGATEGITDYKLSVYNRWGQEVYTTTNAKDEWDGKIGGKDAPSEVYVYYATYQIGGEAKSSKGDVTLIR